VGELGAGDHRVDARVELDLLQRFALIPQGNDRIARASSRRVTIKRVVRLGSTSGMRMGW
jgi:hypothetical protein